MYWAPASPASAPSFQYSSDRSLSGTTPFPCSYMSASWASDFAWPASALRSKADTAARPSFCIPSPRSRIMPMLYRASRSPSPAPTWKICAAASSPRRGEHEHAPSPWGLPAVRDQPSIGPSAHIARRSRIVHQPIHSRIEPTMSRLSSRLCRAPQPMGGHHAIRTCNVWSRSRSSNCSQQRNCQAIPR